MGCRFLALAVCLLVFWSLSCGLEQVEETGSEPAGPLASPATGSNSPPNVLLISLDTFRADRLDEAPFIWELGKRGWVSTHTRSTSDWTLPAHVSLLTSTRPLKHDTPRSGTVIPYMDERLPAEVLTLAEVFRRAGYFTAATTDGGFIVSRLGMDNGFDRFVAEKIGQEDDSFERHVSLATGFIEERDGRPLFLFVHSYEIHDYFLNTPPYHAFVDPETDREHMEHGSWLEEVRLGTAPADYVSRLYDSGVRWTDAFVRRLVTRIMQLTPGENLLVVITSDHGESFGARPGLWHHGQGLWEEQLRVPLVVWGNYETAPQGVSDVPMSLIDVAPSLLSESGIEIPIDFEGRAGLFGLSSDAITPRDERRLRFIHADRIHTGADWDASFLGQVLIGSGWKYYREDSFEGKTRKEVCFDLFADPEETQDRMSDLSSPCEGLAEILSQKLPDSRAYALYITALSSSPLVLEFDDPGAVVGVRSGLGSDSRIGTAEQKQFAWSPREPGESLVLLLGRAPEGEIRLSVGDESEEAQFAWSSIPGSESMARELKVGSHRVRVFRQGVSPNHAGGGALADDETLQQLKALGYVESNVDEPASGE
ncbi:MAG: sulfatase [Myxococcota bacterium]|nr:sulfatase [Myxococcota bacterium]